MKVKCINDEGWVEDRSILWGSITWEKTIKGPKEGDVLTVTGSYYEDGVQYYFLLEWPCPKGGGWQADQFVPLEEKFEEVTYEKIKKEKPISVN